MFALVKQKIAKGWQPLGGVSVTTVLLSENNYMAEDGKQGLINHQALVK